MLLALVLAGALAQNPAGSGLACIPGGAELSGALLCFGDAEVKAGEAMRAGSDDRRRHFEVAVGHFRKVSLIGRQDERLTALTALASLYDQAHLNDPGERETVLRELIALEPDNLAFVFQLADLQERQDLPDAAEQTLLDARQRHPQNIEVYRKLAQFYARRVTALQAPARERIAPDQSGTGGLDKDGVLQVGGAFKPPPRLDVPEFPEEAQAAGIEGVVDVEVLISPEGTVSEAQVVRSVPLLDEPALKAVREWRFQPTIVNGQAVPVKMVVNVRFTLSR